MNLNEIMLPLWLIQPYHMSLCDYVIWLHTLRNQVRGGLEYLHFKVDTTSLVLYTVYALICSKGSHKPLC